MRGSRHWRWHLGEIYVKINGEVVYLWRAVHHEGEVLESYVTKKRQKCSFDLHEQGTEAAWIASEHCNEGALTFSDP